MSDENFVTHVIKRDGSRVDADFTKVDNKYRMLNNFPTKLSCDINNLSQNVRNTITNNMQTTDLDNYAAEKAAALIVQHPDYGVLAGRILMSNIHKQTTSTFSEYVDIAYRNNTYTGERAPRVNPYVFNFTHKHADTLNKMIVQSRDYEFTYIGIATLMNHYLIRQSPKRKQAKGDIIERPQYLWMRLAVAMHMNRADLDDTTVMDDIKESYDFLSLKMMIHATPTMFNAGTPNEQLLSCFLLEGHDSIEGIAKLIRSSMLISKHSGGIGFSMNLRSAGMEVKGTGGMSDGIVPYLAIMEKAMLAVNQGGKRNGSAAHFIEPTHPDFFKWIKLRQPNEVNSITKLFYGLMIPDEFMHRLLRRDKWYFFDPSQCPDLYNSYGSEYSRLYNKYIEEEKYIGEPVDIMDIVNDIFSSQTKTGLPYICFKDHVNNKSNQKNIGTIKNLNLCMEITEFCSPDEYACCCVSSLCLPNFVKTREDGTTYVDYDDLAYCAGVLVKNMNKIIDINQYPVEEAMRGNMRHRPLAIGVQGVADVYHLMKVAFTSPEARKIDKEMFESIYYGCMKKSVDLAERDGAYSSCFGDPINNPKNPKELSPFAQGIFQFDMWGLKPSDLMGKWDWETLRGRMKTYGTRNSLLTSLPPTASTSNIMGNNDAFAPYTDNIYKKKLLSGEFTFVNPHLIRELIAIGKWTVKNRSQLEKDRGSVKSLDIPQEMKDRYKTVWEIKQSDLVEMDAARGAFVDQAMSSNRYFENPTPEKLYACFVKSWKLGVKTNNYYIHSLSKSKPEQYGEIINKKNDDTTDSDDVNDIVCSLRNKDECMGCT